MRPLNRDIAETVAWLARLDLARHPEVIHRARLLVLDTVACIVAGFGEPEPRSSAAQLARIEPGSVRWPGAEASLGPSAAAFVGAMAACWHEACEGLARAHGRPGLHAVPVALALGLQTGATWGAIMKAVLAGYEIGGRAGEAMRIRPGLHVDGSWGLLGTTATAAAMMGLTAAQTMTALQVAAGQMPVSQIAPIIDGMTARNTFASRACANGIMIASAAVAGVSGTARSFELAAETLASSGAQVGPWAPPGEFLILDGYLKPFAAARHVHYGAACAIEHFMTHGNDTSAITALELAVYPEAAAYCGNRAPTTPIQAQFSLSHGLATALRTGTLGPEAYHPQVFANPEQQRLEKLVSIQSDQAIAGRGARLTITTAGPRLIYAVDSVIGDPERPMTETEVIRKAHAYIATHIGADPADAIIRDVLTTPPDQPPRRW